MAPLNKEVMLSYENGSGGLRKSRSSGTGSLLVSAALNLMIGLSSGLKDRTLETPRFDIANDIAR